MITVAGEEKRIPRKPMLPPRPNGATAGSSESAGPFLDLLAIVEARKEACDDPNRSNPQQRKLLALCQRPITVADLVADMELPVEVVRALLADLVSHGTITIAARPQATTEPPASEVLKEVLRALRRPDDALQGNRA